MPSANNPHVQTSKPEGIPLGGLASSWLNLQIDPTDSKLIADFASANGMTYTARPDDIVYSSKPRPAWVGPGTSATAPVFVHKVAGNVQGYDVTFFLEYAFGSVRRKYSNDISLRKRSIIRIKLPKVFPQVVLDSRTNEPGYISSFPTTIKPKQKVALEGDFNNFFTLYAPAQIQVNVLTLLAPNFMQTLMKSAATFDVEFFGDEMVLATWDSIYDPKVMTTALDAMREQLTYMERLLVSWNYTPVRQPFDLLEYTYFSGETIKIGPLRLSPFMLLLIIAIFFVLLGFAIVASK